MTSLLKLIAWPFLIVGFVFGFFLGALALGFFGGFECINALTGIIVGDDNATQETNTNG